MIKIEGAVYNMLSKETISQSIHTGWAGRDVVYLDVTDSTNTQAKLLGETGAVHGTLVVADKQEGGKGRRGRNWVSEPGVGIWMSLLMRPEIATESVSMLTLVIAMAVEKGIREVTGIESQIKWPNDLVVNKKKICGILTEMSTDRRTIKYVVGGVGINVAHEIFPEEIRETATSLYLESGVRYDRAAIIGAIMNAWEEYYEIFAKTEDLSELMKEYNQKLVNLGNEVCVLAADGTFRGISEGINAEGALLVRLADGSLTEVISGEVSVRGVYGYV